MRVREEWTWKLGIHSECNNTCIVCRFCLGFKQLGMTLTARFPSEYRPFCSPGQCYLQHFTGVECRGFLREDQGIVRSSIGVCNVLFLQYVRGIVLRVDTDIQ